MPQPEPSVRSVLPLLTKSRLVEVARDFGVALAPSATKDVQVEALAAKGGTEGEGQGQLF